MSHPAVRLTNISKTYCPGQLLISHLFSKHNAIYALKNINACIEKGEMVIVIGNNGSGKSTLLRIIAGITRPTTGKVETYGRIAPVLELLAGFHPDLSGKENIIINGLLMGMTRKEVDEKYKEIVSFSELDKYTNYPFSTYSDGMKLRLAFSVAIKTNPDILIIDEVFAVGDYKFRVKCVNEIRKLRFKKKTFILATHLLEIIDFFSADKVIWLEKGGLVDFGAPEKVLPKYNLLNSLNSKQLLTQS